MIHSVEIRSKKNEGPNDGWPDLKSSLIFQYQKENLQIHYSIIFLTPQKSFEFKSKNFILFKEPNNELQELKEGLLDFLNTNKKFFRFEPIEPNFELILEKDQFAGIKLYCWIDNGNADLSHYTWDSIGVRLYTDQENLQAFLMQIDD